MERAAQRTARTTRVDMICLPGGSAEASGVDAELMDRI